MKKFFKSIVLCLAAFAALGCVKEEALMFDHEQAAFATQDGQILIEAILPASTAADDAVYICGPFNGGDAAIGNIDYLLQKSETVEGKWGIYLDPNTFVSGQTLKDGFWFYSTKDRREVTVKAEEAVHTLEASTGKRYNVYVDRWASYYDAPSIPLPTHTDSYRIWYINDNEVESVNLYMYGDVNDLGGGWPGVATSGTATLGDNLWAYFDIPKADANGMTEHLIFNVNGGKKQIAGEIEPVISFGTVMDYFYVLSSDADGNLTLRSVVDIEHPGATHFIPSTPVVSLYVQNLTEWETVYAYAANQNEIPTEEAFGAWPGVQPVETVTKDGAEYLRFEFEETYIGHFTNLIFNNGGDPEEKTLQSAGGPGLELAADLKLALSPSCYGLVEDTEPYVMNFYVVDETGWDALAVYAWGDKELFGGWPGATPAGTVEWNGVTYKKFTFISTDAGLEENLIFNNNGGGSQLGDLNVKMEDKMFIRITAEGAERIEAAELPAYIYIKNNTGWDGIALYAWGDAEIFGGWPGATPVGQVVVNDVEFTAFAFGDSNIGKTVHLIFNNNNNGIQFDGPEVTLTEELFLDVTADGATIIEKPKAITWVDFYVQDQTGWDALSVYAWGDAEVFGGWPGAFPTETVTFDGVPYKHFRFSDEYLGNAEHFIFNNGGNGTQLADFDVTLAESMFFTVTAEGAALTPDPRSTYSIYVLDKTGWAALSIYGWQTDEPEIFGGWSGAVPSGEVSLCGEKWKRYKIGDGFNGKSYNIIFNNAGAGSQYDVMEISIDRDWFFVAEPDKATATENPGSRIYFEDKTGWAALALYAWGDVEAFGSWPGAAVGGEQTLDGVTYKYFSVPADAAGKTLNLILNNNNGGSQYDVAQIVAGQDFFYTANPDGAVQK